MYMIKYIIHIFIYIERERDIYKERYHILNHNSREDNISNIILQQY